MITLRNLQKLYPPDTLALDDCTVTIAPGEFVIVIGPSGSGKSTLLRCINRLIPPTSGQVIIDGLDVTAATGEQLRQARRAVGMIFQQFNLIKRASVIDNVLAGRLGYAHPIASLFGYFGADDQAIAEECLRQVNLLELADRRADTLSGGQQQRVAIARALAQRPKVILADEPTASLDPKLTRVIMDILKEINVGQGMTLVVSQHLIDVALMYGSRLIGLQSGRIVFDGPPQELTQTITQQIYGDL
ncbi:MAG: phosphonate ABC transporter ATP-binding protein [Candidatus Entotheonellia bacterium]